MLDFALVFEIERGLHLVGRRVAVANGGSPHSDRLVVRDDVAME